MAEGKQGGRNKNDTWGEQELARYMVGSGGGGGAKRTATGAHGSPKTQPKAHTSHHPPRSEKPPRMSSSSSQPSPASPAAGGNRPRDKAKPDTKHASKSSDAKRSSDKVRENPLLKSQERARKSTENPLKSSQDKPQKAAANPSQHTRDTTRSSSKRTEDRSKSKERIPSNRQSSRSERSERGRDDKIQSSSSQKKTDGRSEKQSSSSSSRRDGRHADQRRAGQSSTSRGAAAASSGRGVDGTRGRKDDRHKARDGDGGKRKEKIVVSENPPPPASLPAPGGHPLPQPAAEDEGQLQPMVEVTEEEEEEKEEDGRYSQEEFEPEDYDEDFEEDLEDSEPSGSEGEGPASLSPSNHHPWQQDGSGIDLVEIMQAIDAENKHVSSTTQLRQNQVGRSPDAESEPRPPLEVSPSRRFVDFSTARKKEEVARAARRTRKRGQELLGMIELDRVTFDLFDLPPLSEYELYVKKFGADNTRQVWVQTGEDVLAVETQTEQVCTAERWVQWPPEDLRGYGGGVVEGLGAEEEEEDEPAPGQSGAGAAKLLSFLQRTSHVCSVLLKENLSASGTNSMSHSVKSPFPFCSTCTKIEAVPYYLSGRCVCGVGFSPTQPHLFLAAYPLPPSATPAADSGVKAKGLLCLWSTRDTLQPQMVLECQAPPTCCCFSPQKASLAFAGTEDGSVVVWDLREPWSMHQHQQPLRGLDSPPRVPTFSTAGIPQLGNHQAPIFSITPLATEHGNGAAAAAVGTGSLGDSEALSGLSFQLTTLDTSGQLNLWVVVESHAPDPYGSESDLGLVPGGRVKLVKSAALDVSAPTLPLPLPASPALPPGPFRVHSFQFHPQDANHLYIGTDTGCVRHVTRYGKRAVPSLYTAGGSAVSNVTSISFSGQQPDHFLVGCSNGTLRLHLAKRADPILTWRDSTNGVGVVTVKWVEPQPGVFIVQDEQSTLYMWDLLQSDGEPVYKQKMASSITCLHLPPYPPKPPSPHVLLLALSDGVVEVHQLGLAPSDSVDQRSTQFTQYLNTVPVVFSR